MTHRRRYAVATSRETVIDLLALDPLNPRSVIHQLDAIAGACRPACPARRRTGLLSPLQRAMLQTYTALAGADGRDARHRRR